MRVDQIAGRQEVAANLSRDDVKALAAGGFASDKVKFNGRMMTVTVIGISNEEAFIETEPSFLERLKMLITGRL